MLRSLDFLSSRDSSTSFQHEGFAHAGKVLWLAPPQTAELISILESWELFPDLWPAPPASGLSLILICFLLSFCQSVWVPCFSVFTISGLESKPREMKDTFRGNENSFLFNMRALSWVVFTTYLLKRWVFNWMYKWVNPPVVLPLMCRIKGHRIRDGQWWPVFFFFFFSWMNRICLVNCRGQESRGKDSGNKDFEWVKDGLLPIIFDPCVCVTPVRGSLAGRPSGSVILPGNVTA